MLTKLPSPQERDKYNLFKNNHLTYINYLIIIIILYIYRNITFTMPPKPINTTKKTIPIDVTTLKGVECDSCHRTIIIQETEIKRHETFVCGFCAKLKIENLEEKIKSLINNYEKKLSKFEKSINDMNVSKEDNIQRLEKNLEESKEKLTREIEKKIEETKHTVKNEWTAVVKKNLRKEVKSAQITINRENNIIIKGLDNTPNIEDKVKEIFTILEIDHTNISEIKSINAEKKVHRITTKDRKYAIEALQNRKKLTNQDDFKDIILDKDLSKEDQHLQYLLRQELKKLKKDPNNKEKIYFIKNGAIMNKPRPNFLGLD